MAVLAMGLKDCSSLSFSVLSLSCFGTKHNKFINHSAFCMQCNLQSVIIACTCNPQQ